MKKLCSALFIVIVCLFLQACSYSVEFVFVNESDTVIEVEYVAQGISYGDDGPTVQRQFVPHTMTYGKWDLGYEREDWQPVKETAYRVDLPAEKFVIKLPPRTALRLAEVNDSVIFRKGEDFELKRLQVRGAYGNMSFEGRQLFNQFVERRRFSYFISYKKDGSQR